MQMHNLLRQNACEFEEITFTNNTIIPAGVVVDSFIWDFDGNGTADLIQTGSNTPPNPTFTYDLGGIDRRCKPNRRIENRNQQ